MATRELKGIQIDLEDGDDTQAIRFILRTVVDMTDGSRIASITEEYTANYADQSSAVQARLDQIIADAHTWMTANEPLL